MKLVPESSEENPSSTSQMKVHLGPTLQVFSYDQEKELSAYILDKESRFYGLTTKDIRGLA